VRTERFLRKHYRNDFRVKRRHAAMHDQVDSRAYQLSALHIEDCGPEGPARLMRNIESCTGDGEPHTLLVSRKSRFAAGDK
jgi:hypothetical protein